MNEFSVVQLRPKIVKIHVSGRRSPLTIKLEKQGGNYEKGSITVYTSFIIPNPDHESNDGEHDLGTFRVHTKAAGRNFREEYVYLSIIGF